MMLFNMPFPVSLYLVFFVIYEISRICYVTSNYWPGDWLTVILDIFDVSIYVLLIFAYWSNLFLGKVDDFVILSLLVFSIAFHISIIPKYNGMRKSVEEEMAKMEEEDVDFEDRNTLITAMMSFLYIATFLPKIPCLYWGLLTIVTK
jgi:hypothetical protein